MRNDALSLFQTSKRLHNKLNALPQDIKQAHGDAHAQVDELDKEKKLSPKLFDEDIDDQTTGCKLFKTSVIDDTINRTKDIARNTVNKIKTPDIKPRQID